MAKYTFPAILTHEDDCYYVRFPDIENCFTDGGTRSEALAMANDVLALMLCDFEDRGPVIPKPSAVRNTTVAANEEIVLIDVDTAQYRRLYSNEQIQPNVCWENVHF